MNARLSEENVVRTGKRILGLAGLASLALLCGREIWAQSQPVQAQSTAARPVAAAPATAPNLGPTSSARPAKLGVSQDSSAKRPAPKGPSEGIKVHGHWIIEVRNPDGKVVTHREFENSLSFEFGGVLLTAVLGRQNSVGAWAIAMDAPLAPASPSLCTNTNQAANLALTAGSGVGGCTLAESNGQYILPCTDANGCFPNLLSPTVALNSSQVAVLTLTGQMTAEQAGTIGQVATLLTTCAPSSPPGGLAGTACDTVPVPANQASAFPPVIANLGTSFFSVLANYGLPVTRLVLGQSPNCGGPGLVPCQLPVNQNQVVAVTVQISFQ
jgi:hypothetical protein